MDRGDSCRHGRVDLRASGGSSRACQAHSGTSVTGAFEGWFKNPDGSFSLLLGYYNRNRDQELDLPIGPNNRIEPGGPDRGQPTHFLPGRGWGMFAVKVPADFGDNKITWTIVANGKTTVIPASLKPDYEISPFVEAAVGNTPPVLTFRTRRAFRARSARPHHRTKRESGRSAAADCVGLRRCEVHFFVRRQAGKPRTSSDRTLDALPRARRGLILEQTGPAVEKIERKDSAAVFNGKATTTATFSQPGEYILHIVANDYSGEGGRGFQCCWTNGQVKVSVQP